MSQRRRRIRAGFVGLGLVLAIDGCRTQDQPLVGNATRRDSAGIEIVETMSHSWDETAPWQVSPTPLLTVGDDSGDSTQLVWKVVGAARLSDGKLAILSGSARQILIFDRRGRFVRAIGRPGRGPGEFSLPQHFQYASGDTLTVWEAHFGPVTSFDPNGNVLRSRKLDLSEVTEALGHAGFSENLTPLSDGSFVAHVHVRSLGSPPLEKLFRGMMAYIHVRPDYGIDSLGLYGGAESMYVMMGDRRFPGFPLFRTRSTIVGGANPPRIYVSNGDRFDIREFDLAGKLVRIIRSSMPPFPIGPGERDAHRDWLIAINAKNEQGKDQLENMFRIVPGKSSYPAVMDMLVDREGYLWIKVKPEHWGIVNPAGVWLGVLKIPLTDILDVGSNFIIGVVRDHLTVERVEEYHLKR